MPERNLAVLVGNGLSIAFNPSLNLGKITREVIARIAADDEGGEDVVNLMRRVALRALPDGEITDDDFEKLVGAFISEGKTLGELRALAGVMEPNGRKLKRAIKRVSRFARRVRDTGVSHVLEVIFENTYAGEADMSALHLFVGTILSDFDGRITFANLNYDTLLLSALLHECNSDTLADMGHGYHSVTVNIGGTRQVPRLRRHASEFPNRRIRLVHLHGSLTYWRQKKGNHFAKLTTEFLREHDMWGMVRRNEVRVRPVIVLATQRDKADEAEAYPFSLAYEIYTDALAASDHWLIVGYSFRDEIVNAKLREAFAQRETPPTILVVTHGDSPSRSAVRDALGWEGQDSRSWLYIFRGGADDMPESNEWAAFSAPF